MVLSKNTLKDIHPQSSLDIPGYGIFELPEKILQFGTGVLLRGLPDYFVDKANKQGIFNGRIVVVKSTGKGDTDAFAEQDNLYTQCIKGIDNGQQVDEAVINAAVSRVLAANGDWQEILACAASPDMKIIISNTTEVGIALVDDDIHANPPVSFPGKLLALLLARYNHFKGAPGSGMVIIPTELVPENGTRLMEIVIEQARRHGLDEAFTRWLLHDNAFCNSLVDRIVPGKLPAPDQQVMEKKLGYTDNLAIMSEVYRLWAIETSSREVEETLSFGRTDSGVVIAPDIDKFRELKLRLLNGSHTFTCGLAVWTGFAVVKQAMGDAAFTAFISALMMEEIAPAITSEKVTEEAARTFAAAVLDRFRNPFIEHQWLSICLQYTSKMKMRNVPAITRYYEKTGAVPRHMAAGFAAYLLFMKSVAKADGTYAGNTNGREYVINDDYAADLHATWQRAGDDIEALVAAVLGDTRLWGVDLARLPGFATAVAQSLLLLLNGDAGIFFSKFSSERIASR